jgi:hypothetical protein
MNTYTISRHILYIYIILYMHIILAYKYNYIKKLFKLRNYLEKRNIKLLCIKDFNDFFIFLQKN